MKFIKFILINLFLCSLDPSASAENKFIVLQPDQPIPKDRFIYVVLDLRDGTLHMGYSKTELEYGKDRRITGGVRNGGHVELLKRVLGVPKHDANELKAILPRAGEGFAVGGGFILGSDGKTYLHRSMSNKAAGQAGSVLNSTINPLLPKTNPQWAALVPQIYAKQLYSAIARVTRTPLKLDGNITNSERFVFNFYKHKNVSEYVEGVCRGTSWMQQVIDEVNFERFKSPIPDRSNEMTLENLYVAADTPELQRNVQRLFSGEKGQIKFAEIFLRGPGLSDKRKAILILRSLYETNSKIPNLNEASLRFISQLTPDVIHLRLFASLVEAMVKNLHRFDHSEKINLYKTLAKSEFTRVNTIINALPESEKLTFLEFYAKDKTFIRRRGYRLLTLAKQLIHTPAIIRWYSRYMDDIVAELNKIESEFKFANRWERGALKRRINDVTKFIPDELLQYRKLKRAIFKLDRKFQLYGETVFENGCLRLTYGI